MAAEAATLTVIVIAGNTLLRPIVNAINRIPLAGGKIEATYVLTITTEPAKAPALREILVSQLELMRYPVADTKIIEQSDDQVEIRASLVTSVSPPSKRTTHQLLALAIDAYGTARLVPT